MGRPAIATHGTTARYRSGCRCEPCTSAMTVYCAEFRVRRQAATSTAPVKYRRWTPEEDALVLSEAGPYAVARRLGRTYYAVITRRTRLRAAQRA